MIIGDELLASAIGESVATALTCPCAHVKGGRTIPEVFHHSLNAAISDIANHKRGELFQRLISYRPPLPEGEEAPPDDGPSLTDEEYGACVEFIFSHMVNRFKGELAELLALEPCIRLVERLKRDGRLPADAVTYWGDMIGERTWRRDGSGKPFYSHMAKGADGMILTHGASPEGKSTVNVLGVVEIKSMLRPKGKLLDQVDRHIGRLGGGLALDGVERKGRDVRVAPARGKTGRLVKIIVLPSDWKLSREWRSVDTEHGREILYPSVTTPPRQEEPEEIAPSLWKVTLAWSQEAIEKAAYEMTFWYMAKVGEHVFATGSLPRGWEEMTHAQAGANSIKMILYYVLLRPLSRRRDRLATKLYNFYCFGYQAAVDNNEMLWPSDFPHEGRT